MTALIGGSATRKSEGFSDAPQKGEKRRGHSLFYFLNFVSGVFYGGSYRGKREGKASSRN